MKQHIMPVVLTVFTLFWSVTAVCIFHYGWLQTWNALVVPAMYPPFADMRTIQGAVLSISSGYNPQLVNPGDPWGRAMNYPVLWINIASFLGLDNETHFIFFVLVCVAGYLITCLKLLKEFPSIYMLLAMISGSCLLAVERGNTDLLIFTLVAATIWARPEWLRASILAAAVALKIYPFVTVIGYARRNINVAIVTSIFALGYLALIYDQLSLIHSGNTASGPLSYGIQSNVLVKVGLMLLPGALVFLLQKKGSSNLMFASECTENARNLFIAGGLIFVLTFVLAKNWDYRLIFLLFCLPYVCSFNNKLVSLATLACVLLSMNVLALSRIGSFMLVITDISKYFLYIIIFLALGHALLQNDKS